MFSMAIDSVLNPCIQYSSDTRERFYFGWDVKD